MPENRMAVDDRLMKAFGDLRSVADDIRYGRHTATVLAASVRAIAEEIRTAARDVPALRDAGTGRDSGDGERDWKWTGRTFVPAGNERGQTEWDRPSTGERAMFPIGFDPNLGRSGTVHLTREGRAVWLRPGETFVETPGPALADPSGGEKP